MQEKNTKGRKNARNLTKVQLTVLVTFAWKIHKKIFQIWQIFRYWVSFLTKSQFWKLRSQLHTRLPPTLHLVHWHCRNRCSFDGISTDIKNIQKILPSQTKSCW